jgi:Ubiquitin family
MESEASKQLLALRLYVCGDISGLVDGARHGTHVHKRSGMFGLQEFAEMLQDREGIPPEQSRFVFNCRQLQTDQTLGHYRIQPGNTVVHFLRLPRD